MYRLSLFCAQDIQAHELFSIIRAASRETSAPQATPQAANAPAAATLPWRQRFGRQRFGRLLSRLMAEPQV
ncbi:hypothetical protein [Rhizobium straminoryzae]|uniref:hypothetical protein n=1 Tax=Rhizobium straminoryzae TaxID=1387186 RepID=UPI00163D91F1|nr:hypothetical protein [Rhizobium straminoryzae]